MNVNGFWNKENAREKSPVVSRPDLVAERNAAIRGAGDLRPHERAPVKLSRMPVDNRVRFYRAVSDGAGGYILGSCYAVLSMESISRLRSEKRLESWLEQERESGVIVSARYA